MRRAGNKSTHDPLSRLSADFISFSYNRKAGKGKKIACSTEDDCQKKTRDIQLTCFPTHIIRNNVDSNKSKSYFSQYTVNILPP